MRKVTLNCQKMSKSWSGGNSSAHVLPDKKPWLKKLSAFINKKACRNTVLKPVVFVRPDILACMFCQTKKSRLKKLMSVFINKKACTNTVLQPVVFVRLDFLDKCCDGE